MIRQFAEVRGGEIVGPVDVCIVGSGAGGSVAAYYLANAGYSTVVLEKGGYFGPEELGRKEVSLLTRIQNTATLFTPVEGRNTRVSLISGECVGGGTVASESVTWDLPQVVLEDWVRMDLPSFAPGLRMRRYQDELNTLLNVHPVPDDHHNGTNQILKIGAAREGLAWKSVDRPVEGCRRCGNCTQGCRFGAKRDGSFLLRGAAAKGADIIAGARADRFKINFADPADRPGQNRLAVRQQSAPAKFTITATVIDRKAIVARDAEPAGKGVTVHARNLVLAAGPVGTTRLLLKSGINPAGVVGRRFGLHPTSFNIGWFPGLELRGWDGINDTIEVHHFADLNRRQPYYRAERHGFLLEGALSLPWGLANLLPGAGGEHLSLMANMNHMAGIEVNVKSDSYGRITEDTLEFELSERDNEAMLYGTWITARILLRAGAKEIYTGLPGLILRSPSELEEIFKRRQRGGFRVKQANLYTGHIFGGAVMGASRESSFVDETGQCHDVKGLWVADGSAFPTNVGVNCAMSIMVVARKIADDMIATLRSALPGR